MKKLLFLALIATMASCNWFAKKEHPEEILLDAENGDIWVYEGTLPCADCEGIHAKLSVQSATGYFKLEETYLGKDETRSFEILGTFSDSTITSPEGVKTSLYTLTTKTEPARTIYLEKWDPTLLLLLDHDAKRVVSEHNYALSRIVPPANQLKETAEIDGKTLMVSIHQSFDENNKPNSDVQVSFDGQVVFEKSYTATLRFLVPESFGRTNPIPTNLNVILALGGEFVEVGHFLFFTKSENYIKAVEKYISPVEGESQSIELFEIPLQGEWAKKD